ncbi:MAG: hypothetical protein HY815_27115 [Candidatus Riflebacteria bacterium]|nr:hypothetical protein [Candidatus Riflebacteria bacterium]
MAQSGLLLLALASILTIAGPAGADPVREARKLLYRIDTTPEEDAAIEGEPSLKRYQRAVRLLEEAWTTKAEGDSLRRDLLHAYSLVDQAGRAEGQTEAVLDNARGAGRTLGRTNPFAARLLGDAELFAGDPGAAAVTFLAVSPMSLTTDDQLAFRLGLVKAYTLQAFDDPAALRQGSAEAEGMLVTWPSHPEVRFNAGFLRALGNDDQGAIALWEATPDLLTRPEWEQALFKLLSRKSRGAFSFEVGSGVPLVEMAKLFALFRQAYLDLGRRLAVFPNPSRPTQVLLISAEEYQKQKLSWSRATYAKNQIRIRFDPGATASQFRDTIYHELTHNLVDLKTGGNIPAWLSEGLAMCLDQNPANAGYEKLLSTHLSTQAAIPLADLAGQGPWEKGPQAASLAYAHAFSAVRHLVKYHGYTKVNRLLGHLGAQRPFGEAFEEAIGMRFELFERDWLRDARAN